MQKDDAIVKSTGDSFKPDIATIYNKTQSCTDVVDRMKGEYYVSKSNRWLFTVSCGLLNIAIVNGKILFTFNTTKSLQRNTCNDCYMSEEDD